MFLNNLEIHYKKKSKWHFPYFLFSSRLKWNYASSVFQVLVQCSPFVLYEISFQCEVKYPFKISVLLRNLSLSLSYTFGVITLSPYSSLCMFLPFRCAFIASYQPEFGLFHSFINRIFLSNLIAFIFYENWLYQQWFNRWGR